MHRRGPLYTFDKNWSQQSSGTSAQIYTQGMVSDYLIANSDPDVYTHLSFDIFRQSEDKVLLNYVKSNSEFLF